MDIFRGRTEVERREMYMTLLDAHPDANVTLFQLIKQCLQNRPKQRPSTDELLTQLREIREQVEKQYGGPVKLNFVKFHHLVEEV